MDRLLRACAAPPATASPSSGFVVRRLKEKKKKQHSFVLLCSASVSPEQSVAMGKKLATADLCDEHMDAIASGEVRVLPPSFQCYGGLRRFAGPISTVKIFEDNSIVRQTLEEAGQGRVLLIDGGGSLRCALLGGTLTALAQTNGWAGIIVNGCIRDIDEINACEFGVRALASHPLRTVKRGEGVRNVAVCIAGVQVAPGNWCYADIDGVVISDTKLPKF